MVFFYHLTGDSKYGMAGAIKILFSVMLVDLVLKLGYETKVERHNISFSVMLLVFVLKLGMTQKLKDATDKIDHIEETR